MEEWRRGCTVSNDIGVQQECYIHHSNKKGTNWSCAMLSGDTKTLLKIHLCLCQNSLQLPQHRQTVCFAQTAPLARSFSTTVMDKWREAVIQVDSKRTELSVSDLSSGLRTLAGTIAMFGSFCSIRFRNGCSCWLLSCNYRESASEEHQRSNWMCEYRRVAISLYPYRCKPRP